MALFLRITLATALRIICSGVKADAARPDTIINPGKTWWQLGAGALSLGWCKWPDFLNTMKIGLKGFIGGIFVPCERKREVKITLKF